MMYTAQHINCLFFRRVLIQEMWCNVSESGYISAESTGKGFVVRITSLPTLRWVHDKVQILWLNLLSVIAPSPKKTLPLPLRVFTQTLHL